MGKTRRAIAAVAVVATLGSGGVTAACTGPPPTQQDIDNLGTGLAQLFWLAFAAAFNLCLAPCDPGPGQA